MSIGQRIKAAREHAGITQVELGEKIGVSGVAIMRYEKGTREPRLEQLQRIAFALETTVSELVEPEYWSTVSKEEAEESWSSSSIQAVTIPPQQRISAALGKLNGAGMEKAADAVEVIAEVPRYQSKAEDDGKEN